MSKDGLLATEPRLLYLIKIFSAFSVQTIGLVGLGPPRLLKGLLNSENGAIQKNLVIFFIFKNQKLGRISVDISPLWAR